MQIPRLPRLIRLMAFVRIGMLQRGQILVSTLQTPFTTTLKLLLHKPPWTVTLADGHKARFESRQQLSRELASRYFKVPTHRYEWAPAGFSGSVVITEPERGDVFAVFEREDYRWLDVAGKTVIDVGAGVGDSAVYFARRGAYKVVGFEASAELARIAERNIQLNNVQDRVAVFACAVLPVCEDHANCLMVLRHLLDPRNPSAGPIPGPVSFNCVLEGLKDHKVALKIDCEGCEYELLQQLSDRALDPVGDVVLEFHYGFKGIKAGLEKRGYYTRTSPSHFGWNSQSSSPAMLYGYLYASRAQERLGLLNSP